MTTESILDRLQIKELNNMQQTVIQKFEKEKDFILLSPTGSGKTLAFALLIEQVLSAQKEGTQVIIVIPTRELALQIETVIRKVSQGHKIVCCYGGHDSRSEKKSLLQDPPSIVIGTPGRVIYHIERQNIDTHTIHTLILDEYDKSLELGFQEQLETITRALATIKRKILTSATRLVETPSYFSLQEPVLVDFLGNQEDKPKITFKKVTSPAQHKLKALFKLICKLGDNKILIFCNHRDAVDHISDLLDERDLIHDIFHGGLEQRDRELSLLKFRNNSNRILLTTDLAARGLDIPEIDTIIHYQLPSKEDAFIHRNGRTARMHNTGEVVLMLKPDDDFPYLSEPAEEIQLDEEYPLPPNTPFSTLYTPLGRKDKVNKIDIVGYLLHSGKLQKEDIGLIEVKEKETFIAVRRAITVTVIREFSEGKIKGKKVKFYRT